MNTCGFLHPVSLFLLALVSDLLEMVAHKDEKLSKITTPRPKGSTVCCVEFFPINNGIVQE